MEKTVERLSKEAHEAKLNATKSQENCVKESALKHEFSIKILNMEKEREILLEGHEKFINETKTYYDNLVKDLEQKIQEIKEYNLRELENSYQQRVTMINEEKKSKEHYKSIAEELKEKLQNISSEHQQEIHDVIAKHAEQIADFKQESQSKVLCIYLIKYLLTIL